MWQIFHWLKEMLQAIAFVNINSEVVNLFKLMLDISLVENDQCLISFRQSHHV